MKSRKTTPQFRDVEDIFRVRHQMQERPDDDARHQITEHGAKAEFAENRRRDDSAGQKQQGFGKESVVLGHAG